MIHNQEGPCVLISSPSDLESERFELSNYLKLGFQAYGSYYRPLLWEEETDGGRRVSSKDAVQRQIDELLAGRVQMTIVMLGERIGSPLRGDLPDKAQAVLEEWGPDGLTHPWPDEPEAATKLLDSGKFPLTGTVYELLVARDKNTPGGFFVGYVANRHVTPDLTLDQITFNQGRLYATKIQTDPHYHVKYKEREYDPQVKGLLNLLKALSSPKRGTWIQRFEIAEDMYKTLGRSALDELLSQIPDRSGQLPYKANMEHYAYDDPLPLPDRLALRSKLKPWFVNHSQDSEMMVLEGPSGCGKSSLMQKGVLGDLPYEISDAKVVVFRPTDLYERPESTPLGQILGLLCERLEQGEDSIRVPLGLRKPFATRTSDIPSKAAAALGEALDSAGRPLALGVDQFEELIDLVTLDEGRRDTKGSWWQILRFLAAALRHERVFVIGTLERMRRDNLEKLQLKERTGLTIREYNADFPIGEVRSFVISTAGEARLSLSKDLIDDIYNMVEAFEDEKARSEHSRVTASFLPLLAIWLSRLFSLFRDRMLDVRGGASQGFEQAAQAITREDLEQRGITLTLAPLIGEMMQAAWDEAGELPQETRHIEDPNKMVSAIQRISQNPRLRPGIQRFLDSDNKFDLDSFLSFANMQGVHIPGVRWTHTFNESTIENFFNALVAIDAQDNIRLIDTPRRSRVTSMQSLIDAHERRRLLVPTGADRVRLVHQATIDNWPPAMEWFEQKKSVLISQRRIRHLLGEISEYGSSLTEILENRPAALDDAVRVLDAKRATWTGAGGQPLTEQDRKLRQICLEILALAERGDRSVEVSGKLVFLIHTAAEYDLHEVLESWLSKDRTLVDLESQPLKLTPLHKAAWGAKTAVQVLLRYGAKAKPDKEGWHPIAGAIQPGRMDVFADLYSAYSSPLGVIGPANITILHEAARASDPAILNYLLHLTEQVDPRDEFGRTPFHYAAAQGRTAQIGALMECCDRLAIDSNGDTALNRAIFKGHDEAVATILDHDALTDAEREVLLTGTGIEGIRPMPAIVLAAEKAQTKVLDTLTNCCDLEDALLRDSGGRHALGQLTYSNFAHKGGAPLADRVTDCVQLLLERCAPSSKDVADALRSAGDFPDAARLLKAWLVENGVFEGVSDSDLLDWLTGPQTNAALSVLRNAPGVLDKVDESGVRCAILLIARGRSEVVAAALEEGLLPENEPELFRLEAALRLIKDGVPLPRLAQPPHPLVKRIVNGEAPELKAILEAMLPDQSGFHPLPHRLALRNQQAAFAAVVSPLNDGIPRDLYGRPPSAMAPPNQQQLYRELEFNNLRGMQ
ncbi:MAG TPA: ankyrin repeat domain-containing protein [Pyrinomonadaceae bacterium]